MILSDFRQTDELRKWFYNVTQDPRWKSLMECMENAHVRHYQLSPVGPSDSDRVLRLGRIEGWDTYANTLASAALPPTEQKPLGPPTFDDPTKEKE